MTTFTADPFRFIPSPLPDDITIAVYRKTVTSGTNWLLAYKGKDINVARAALTMTFARAETTDVQTIGVWGEWGTPEYTDIRADITPDGTVSYKRRNNERSNREHKPIYQTLMVPAVLPVADAAKAA